MVEFLGAAIEEAGRGLAEGGIPIGSVLVVDGRMRDCAFARGGEREWRS